MTKRSVDFELGRWDDVRVFLAVMRQGSFGKAAVALGLDQSTTSRRTTALEQAMGRELFERRADGLHPTELAARLFVHAEASEAALNRFIDEARGHEREAKGRVTIATTETIATRILYPGALLPLRKRHPEIDAVVLTGDSIVDMPNREADIALRFAKPTTGELVSRRVATLRSVPIASRGYAEEHGTQPPRELDWIVISRPGFEAPEEVWLRDSLGVEPRLRTNSHASQLAAVEAGLGVAMLSRALLAAAPDLVALALDVPSGPELALYLVTHERLRSLPRIVAVMDAIEAACRELDAPSPSGGSAPGRGAKAPRAR